MALKIKQSISASDDRRDEIPEETVPVLFQSELDEHKKDERVRARLERVEERAKTRTSTS